MSRPIRFRVWDANLGQLVYPDSTLLEDGFLKWQWDSSLGDYVKSSGSYTQFTGLTDSKGIDIYEGDIICYYEPRRSYQTHYGDNIPGPEGSYTEQLEPYIETKIKVVNFFLGTFTFDTKEEVEKKGFVWPLENRRDSYQDTEDLMRAFDCRRTQTWIDNGDDETGDCSYLCREYGLADEAALITHLNTFEVIGNIFQNPNLLK